MSDMIYRLILRARFEDEAEIERVLHGLERLQIGGAKVSVSMGEVGREGTAGLQRLARAGLSVGFMFNMLESAYMRQTLAVLTLDNAQERYNNTVEKYGINSKKAQDALKQLELRTNYLNMANMRANVSMGLMLTQLAIQSKLLDASTLSTIANTAATTAATIKEWLHVAALKAKAVLMAITSSGVLVPAMMIAGVATAGAIGYYTGTAASSAAGPTNINIEAPINVTPEQDLDTALDQFNKKVKEEYRSIEGD